MPLQAAEKVANACATVEERRFSAAPWETLTNLKSVISSEAELRVLRAIPRSRETCFFTLESLI